jgi:hypothetical protein
MIQNERQYKITQTKLKDLKLDLAALDLPADLHPRQVLARKNSVNILIGELEQEIADYNRLKSGQINKWTIESFEDLPRITITYGRLRQRSQDCCGDDSEGTGRKNWRSRAADPTI